MTEYTVAVKPGKREKLLESLSKYLENTGMRIVYYHITDEPEEILHIALNPDEEFVNCLRRRLTEED